MASREAAQLPSELLTEIFSVCMPTDDVHALDTSVMPWTANQVCQQWRTVCSGSPHLWNKINIFWPKTETHILRLDPKNRSHIRNLAHRLAQRLKYADDRPLFITIDLKLNNPLDAAYMKTLWASHKYWKEIRIATLPFDGVPQWLEKLPFYPDNEPVLPFLTDLKVTFADNKGESEASLPFFRLFRNTPALRRVWFGANPYFLAEFPLEHFQELTLQFNSETHYLATVLQRSRRLVKLQIQCRMLPLRLTTSHTITSLRYLDLDIPVKESAVLLRLTAPRLQTLMIGLQYEALELNQLTTFLTRSECKLTRFYWRANANPGDDMGALLQHMPYLQSLSLIGITPRMFEQAITVLTPTEQGAPGTVHYLKPELTHQSLSTLTLSVWYRHYTERTIPIPRVASFLEARMQCPQPRLRHVHIIGDCDTNAQDLLGKHRGTGPMQRLEELIEARGLDVRITGIDAKGQSCSLFGLSDETDCTCLRRTI